MLTLIKRLIIQTEIMNMWFSKNEIAIHILKHILFSNITLISAHSMIISVVYFE